jgi:nitrous oxide reductase accessory protein NosL
MKCNLFKGEVVALSATLLILIFTASCKGRTLDNVQATGDTIEVTVDSICTTPIEPMTELPGEKAQQQAEDNDNNEPDAHTSASPQHNDSKQY